ncbi:CDP-diacylglycerol--serine O-phosphatidyltransferase [Bacillus sonorensis]|uniref:CDP-diacylglycerol--serine O-phosphatidyltransferase n=2 Tax=Bacillus sonorensis TaxID=119858 RepID=M5P0I9_9BACI|nr:MULTISPECIES: CDP-diacylglycerol--serine O-phosphatidyltransferase [Bacillus]TWK75653.1 CDP-diacylglycerol--glycerol-3-phosphate 3-phosphatidyltransferase [Bacillus paralicheniformis]ASB90562.1 CDP-diacylglycerol--serine O-phosphatidyltransferase [Bacillus sonorensis]EME72964.1 CDP-diacylglycerol--serine O-phosphatidyltransferase [Bacillus sonorensis L12]MBG9913980.1 phosphatidylserine synthase [Bacillus sonorensis]MCF7616794.1 CDP-diacylglycerol--serine O-phosphatidyltransferase [Bacillus 
MKKTIIPSLITIGNFLSGFSALLLAFKGYLFLAILFVVLGAILDSLDGMAARRLNAVSPFGKELDSLADIITFGIAPAIITYSIVFHDAPIMGLPSTLLFPVCGALRLARFNIQSGEQEYFTGVPITAAGTILVCLNFLFEIIGKKAFIMITLFLSYLMVSKIKVISLKGKNLLKKVS